MNDFIENFKNVLSNKYAEFNGRANRAEFWKFFLVVLIINFLFSILANMFGGVKILSLTFNILSAIFSLAILVPTIALGVRRMHDIGKSGSWLFINFIPIIGGIWFLILAIKESDGPNQYGEK